MGIEVKNESFATRCEICHKSDCFEPLDNKCNRCDKITIKTESFTPINDYIETTNYWSLLLCKLGFHKWQHLRWERCCLRCKTVQHVWRIIDNSILWRTLEDEPDNYLLESLYEISSKSTPLPLRKWQCWHCNQSVMRIHPPGVFEPCQYCGTLNYVLREKAAKN